VGTPDFIEFAALRNLEMPVIIEFAAPCFLNLGKTKCGNSRSACGCRICRTLQGAANKVRQVTVAALPHCRTPL
jgi:hypothetical protein